MLLGLLLACTDPPSSSDDTGGAPQDCPQADLSPVPLAGGFSDGTEGLAFARGRLFTSAPEGLYEIAADGSTSLRTSWTQALGLAPAGEGLLVADPGEFTFDGSGDDGRLLRVGLDGGEPQVLAGGMPNPNFVVATAWGEVLVSDDTGQVIYAVDGGGAVRTWLDGVPSPNGMGWSPDGGTLYTVSTFSTDPALWAIPVDGGGAPGTPAAVTTFETGSAPDGLAVDADGGVWVALNLAGEVVRVDPATGEETDRVEGLSSPASLAFGAEETGFDPCGLYVSSLFGDTVSQVAVGRRGAVVPEGPAGD
jgi:hypothetical protein